MQIIHFNEGDVEVSQDVNGKWEACMEEDYFPIGTGSTMMEAIVDLRDKLNDQL